jgi:hypothetical protein
MKTEEYRGSIFPIVLLCCPLVILATVLFLVAGQYGALENDTDRVK